MAVSFVLVLLVQQALSTQALSAQASEVPAAGLEKVEDVASQLQCKPQGLLKLSPPYKGPQAQALTICKQYSACTCCNNKHSTVIQHRLTQLQEDRSFSRGCLSTLRTVHCMVCDPSVGVGLTQAMCPQLCDEWYHECQNDYFLFKHENRSWVHWAPCTKELVDADIGCTLLSKHVLNGIELCLETGHGLDAGGASICYSGQDTHRYVCGDRFKPHAPVTWRTYALQAGIVVAAPVCFALFVVASWKISTLTGINTLYRRVFGVARKRD